MMTPIREEFPSPDLDRAAIKAKLEHILMEHPELSYAFLYDKKNNLMVSRAQPARDKDPAFCVRTQEAINMVATWFPLEAPDLSTRVRMMAEKDEPPVVFIGGWYHQENQLNYWNLTYFLPPNVKDGVVLGAVAFDNDYLQQTFLPAMMKDVLNSKSDVPKADTPPVMMIRPSKDYTPWVTSGNWGGGKPEAERNFTYVFPDMTAAIRFRGQRFPRIADAAGLDSPLCRDVGTGATFGKGKISGVFPDHTRGERTADCADQQYPGLFAHRGWTQGIRVQGNGSRGTGSLHAGILPLPNPAERFCVRGKHLP
jgi:hypothetical protein